MSDSDRDSSGATPSSPSKPFSGSQWTPDSPPRSSANVLPGGTIHTAGGNLSASTEPTITNALSSISFQDFLSLPTKPCVKDSLLLGMTAGFVLGGLRAFIRPANATGWLRSTFRKGSGVTIVKSEEMESRSSVLMSACNYAVGAFCFGSFGYYQYCTYQRDVERKGMKQAMEIIDRKAIERRQREERLERIREMRRKKKEEENEVVYEKLRNDKEEKNKGNSGRAWWKLWS